MLIKPQKKPKTTTITIICVLLDSCANKVEKKKKNKKAQNKIIFDLFNLKNQQLLVYFPK